MTGGMVLNSQGIHDNGTAKVTIGLRADKFVIERLGDKVRIKDPSTEEYLTLSVKDVEAVDGSSSDDLVELDERVSFLEDCFAAREFKSLMVDASGVALVNNAGVILCNSTSMV